MSKEKRERTDDDFSGVGCIALVYKAGLRGVATKTEPLYDTSVPGKR